jgi:outer membrane protein OmpA-like peptidoglycan-associated protein
MDLPKKRSSRYLTGIYAFFIFLFAFTASLFYISRYQKPSGLDEQGAENIEQKEAAEITPIKPETTDSPQRQATNKIEVSESGNEIDNENIKASPSLKVSNGENIDVDKTGASFDRATKQKDNQTQTKPSSISSGQDTILYFSDESTGLTDKALEKLKVIYLFLLKYPDEEIIIEGYGDSSKADRYNNKLSKLRANIIKDYFVKRGISKSRLNAFWMGSDNEAEDKDTLEDKNKNHQVEIKFKFRSQEWYE